jgi:hypothetical protein
LEAQVDELRAYLRKLGNQAWMRLQYHEADEIAAYLGDPLPTDHELADL